MVARTDRFRAYDLLAEGLDLIHQKAMDKIRLLHFADIHVGMENYGKVDPGSGVNARVLDFLCRFDELIDYGLEHDVDLVIFAGGASKRRGPNPT